MSDKRHLWIVNQYATHPARGNTCRHYMLATELVKSGTHVTIFAGSGHHFHQDPPDIDVVSAGETIQGIKFEWIRTPNAAQGQLIKRVIAWLVFTWRLFFVGRGIVAPSTILLSSPSLIPFLSAYILARRYNARLIFEFRDIWPLTFVSMGGFKPWHPLVFVHSILESWALKKSDHCIGTMQYGWRRLKECGLSPDKFTWVPNVYDPSDPDAAGRIPARIKTDFTSDHLNLLYLGSMGRANALEVILDAAERLRGEPVRFILVGQGSSRQELEEAATARNIDNIVFHDPVQKNLVDAVLAEADALLISWRKLPLYRYGTSANKMAEYLAAGKPIVQAYSGEGDLLEKAHAGRTVEAEDPEALAMAILSLVEMSKDGRISMGRNAKKLAHETHRLSSVAKKLIGLTV